MIDSEGFRPNVGIVICNKHGNLLWAKRIGQSAWQFPQGGIKENESLEQAPGQEALLEVEDDRRPGLRILGDARQGGRFVQVGQKTRHHEPMRFLRPSGM